MNFLLKQFEKLDRHFHSGGRLELFKPLWDASFTFLFSPDIRTKNGPHVRDSMDLKRLMIVVVVALLPCFLFGIFNAGYQSLKAAGAVRGADPFNQAIWVEGTLLVLPLVFVSYLVGGFWEVLFAIVRRHRVSEGFLVTGILFPLTCPPDLPLWMAAVGVSFGVVIGKEIFGGTGMNILNPALTARVFIFFAFPADISGDLVWIAHDPARVVDGFSGATALLVAAGTPGTANAVQTLGASAYSDFSFWNLFFGLIPGSIGETSKIACLIGAFVLILTGVGSWRIMASVLAGGLVTAGVLNLVAGPNLPGYLNLPAYYHPVLGGFLFGAIFMATDPVSAAATRTGQFIYGFLIGFLCIMIRIWNPAYPEGMMLAILFMNIFAPLIDHFVVRANIRRRLKRATAG